MSGYGCLVRLGWMFLGSGLLLILAVSIVHHKGSLFSGSDVAYWATVAAIAAVRYFDIARMHGRTAAGKPASIRDWRRYVLILAAAAVGIWAAAHAVAYFGR
jgi:hypothetical protein